MGLTGRGPAQNNNLRRKQASYYERRSGRRAAQEPPVSATFGARGSNHETTSLGPDKTTWLGGLATGTTPVMELAAGPDEVDQALAAADERLLAAIHKAFDRRTALLAIAKAAQTKLTSEGEVNVRLAEAGRHLEAFLEAEQDDPDRVAAFRAKVDARLAAVEAAEPHTPDELATLADLTAQREEIDEAFGAALPVGEAIRAATRGPGFPPDVASLILQDEREIEDLRELTPPSPYVLPQEGPPTPAEIADQVLNHVQQREQGEQ